MGQGASQPTRRTEGGGNRDRLARRASVFRRSLHIDEHQQQDGLLIGQHQHHHQHSRRDDSTPRLRTRPGSVNRLSQLLHMDSDYGLQAGGEENETVQRAERRERSRGSAMLQRTRSTFRDIMHGHREPAHINRRDISRPTPTPSFPHHRSSYMQPGMNGEEADYYPPRLPSIDLNSTFDYESFSPAPEPEAPAPRSSNSHRRPNLRLTSFRPDRPFRSHFPSLRRRRSPQPAVRRIGGAEDQAVLLSQLLSAAATATAATLMGDDHHALNEARSLPGGAGVGEIGGAGEDGSFDGFLRALQNGRIASALRGGENMDSDASPGSQGPLNFFRMFRFGASSIAPADRQRNAEQQNSEDDSNNADGRMVPVIIVGIRSISPGSGPSSSSNEDVPPFIDALNRFPSPLPTHALGTHGHDSIDSILRPPQNGTSFRHRRRASMGGFGMGRSRLTDRMDDQRDHRSPDRRRSRPWSVASSSSALEPRPPPATPASPSPELSRISSRNTTPGHSRPASMIANSMRDLGFETRRNSALHRTSAGSPLSSHTEETISLHSTHSSTNLLSQSQDADIFRHHPHRRSDTAPNIHYPRFASGHPRRNGVVEPDNLPPLSRSSTSAGTDSTNTERRNSTTDSRSWIIYVLGGSYPENHPIVTTPSLFTENPTYEDMMLLSALLGPAKAPVATEEDVENAGGLYIIEAPEPSDAAKTALLVAAATESDERIPIEASQDCRVCLCSFEVNDVARKLAKCNHLFHRECVDQWLTQGRNSCPLCRSQGVDEKEKAAEGEAGESVATATAAAPEPVELDASGL